MQCIKTFLPLARAHPVAVLVVFVQRRSTQWANPPSHGCDQQVAAVLWTGGAFAEECVVAATAAIRLPKGIDVAAAAGLPVAFGTAHLALMERAKLQAGQVLLVLGAAGGVGVAAVQVFSILKYSHQLIDLPVESGLSTCWCWAPPAAGVAAVQAHFRGVAVLVQTHVTPSLQSKYRTMLLGAVGSIGATTGQVQSLLLHLLSQQPWLCKPIFCLAYASALIHDEAQGRQTLSGSRHETHRIEVLVDGA